MNQSALSIITVRVNSTVLARILRLASDEEAFVRQCLLRLNYKKVNNTSLCFFSDRVLGVRRGECFRHAFRQEHFKMTVLVDSMKVSNSKAIDVKVEWVGFRDVLANQFNSGLVNSLIDYRFSFTEI